MPFIQELSGRGNDYSQLIANLANNVAFNNDRRLKTADMLNAAKRKMVQSGMDGQGFKYKVDSDGRSSYLEPEEDKNGKPTGNYVPSKAATDFASGIRREDLSFQGKGTSNTITTDFKANDAAVEAYNAARKDGAINSKVQDGTEATADLLKETLPAGKMEPAFNGVMQDQQNKTPQMLPIDPAVQAMNEALGIVTPKKYPDGVSPIPNSTTPPGTIPDGVTPIPTSTTPTGTIPEGVVPAAQGRTVDPAIQATKERIAAGMSMGKSNSDTVRQEASMSQEVNRGKIEGGMGITNTTTVDNSFIDKTGMNKDDLLNQAMWSAIESGSTADPNSASSKMAGIYGNLYKQRVDELQNMQDLKNANGTKTDYKFEKLSQDLGSEKMAASQAVGATSSNSVNVGVNASHTSTNGDGGDSAGATTMGFIDKLTGKAASVFVDKATGIATRDSSLLQIGVPQGADGQGVIDHSREMARTLGAEIKQEKGQFGTDIYLVKNGKKMAVKRYMENGEWGGQLLAGGEAQLASSWFDQSTQASGATFTEEKKSNMENSQYTNSKDPKDRKPK